MSGAEGAPARSLSDLLRLAPGLRSIAPRAGLEGLQRAVARVMERWPDMAAPDDRDRDAILRDLAARLATDNWQGCRVSRVCDGLRAAFDAERRDREAFGELRQFLLEEIAVTDRLPILNAALAAYLETFAPEAAHTRQLAHALAAARARLAGRAARLAQSFPGLFDPQAIVAEIAAAMAAAETPYARLVELGLRAPHGPGLMDHVHLRFVEEIAPRLAEDAACDRLLAWLRPEGRAARRSGAAEAITAMVRPWLARDPSDKRQALLARRLVDMYGDPRRNSGYPWHEVGGAERAVFLRWLTGENLRLLFDAITDTNDSHMWAERRSFYLGLHRQKRIDQAWVAFAPAGARQARRILREAGHGTGFEFGLQTAKGKRANTSLLILKIGSKIVVDGSHSYHVHIFREGSPNAPALFEPGYDCKDILRHSKEKRRHSGDWQGWVLMRI